MLNLKASCRMLNKMYAFQLSTDSDTIFTLFEAPSRMRSLLTLHQIFVVDYDLITARRP
jgi:hypothetical protein